MPEEPADDPVGIARSIGVKGEVIDLAGVGTGSVVDAKGLIREYLITDV
jgi:hypothetical protein